MSNALTASLRTGVQILITTLACLPMSAPILFAQEAATKEVESENVSDVDSAFEQEEGSDGKGKAARGMMCQRYGNYCDDLPTIDPQPLSLRKS